ncbi:Ig-like domain-containing protein [Streptomyces sp. N2-109]|uniref:Ig-like domain-containing protein n=1 Tax=Streptomyces gossypii TaxID=2883101 RepID=A0ABT2K3F7_9ACTN|nr:Ig-like domain-containing protein [Streptomyces gossypii]MCT2594704.1 Ig-like domain-containing protein [Streptomyces gossypii]
MEKRVMTVGKHRKGIAAVAVLLSGVLTLTACGGDDEGGSGSGDKGKDKSSDSQSKADKAAADEASEARISIKPKDGSDTASINTGGKVTVSKGKLTEVAMVAEQSGTAVEGAIAADGKSWKPAAALERATKYEVKAVAKDSDGREAHEVSTFTTVSPENSFIGYFTPDDGKTVGVGMPVSINFDKPVSDKKAVQSAIKVNSSSGQKVVGHWFSATRLDFRPEEYWKAGSKVTVDLNLDGVDASNGVTGVQDKKVTFNVGHAQVSTVDVKSKKMTVVRDGKTIKTIPISAGSAENPTYNGEMVISEKFKETRMDGSTVGFTDKEGKGEYDIKDVPHAMRLSTSGTFIHGNYWGSDGIFGSANTSHGCVGLNDAKGAGDPKQDGAWFYENSMLGDVVVVKNSPDDTIKADNGLNGWNMSWDKWQGGSAV